MCPDLVLVGHNDVLYPIEGQVLLYNQVVSLEAGQSVRREETVVLLHTQRYPC